MNMSATSMATNAIIQKIPIAKTETTEVPLNVTIGPNSTTQTESVSTENLLFLSTTEIAIAMSTMSQPSSTSSITTMSASTEIPSVTTLTAVNSSTVKTEHVATTSESLHNTTSVPIDLNVKCPELSIIPNVDELTQDEFITKLTDSCRYDRLVKPPSQEPLTVYFQIDMTHVEASDHLVSCKINLIQGSHKYCGGLCCVKILFFWQN